MSGLDSIKNKYTVRIVSVSHQEMDSNTKHCKHKQISIILCMYYVYMQISQNNLRWFPKEINMVPQVPKSLKSLQLVCIWRSEREKGTCRRPQKDTDKLWINIQNPLGAAVKNKGRILSWQSLQSSKHDKVTKGKGVTINEEKKWQKWY